MSVSGKIVSKEQIHTIASRLRAEGKRIVFTNGCFDLLHVGHVRYLQKARAMGDVLVLGLNSDTSVRQLKGPDRPVVSESERAEILAALACVDYVVVFAELLPNEMIKAVRPHLHVKGGDYGIEDLPEAPLVLSLGGEVRLIPLVAGKSTTNLIQQLSQKEPEETPAGHVSRAARDRRRNGKLRVVAIIPARYHSTRLPGKPLLDICGKPMIQWVYEQTRRSPLVECVYVATDDARIYQTVESFGGNAMMTSPDHPSGTDRIAEAAGNIECDVVVNVQGDEPIVEPSSIDQAIMPLLNEATVAMSTLASPVTSEGDWVNPNVVKVVVDKDGFALYFSRATIPFHRDGLTCGLRALRHIGTYVYRKEFLLRFASLPPSRLEEIEQLEQLRALESGERIKVVVCHGVSASVDTPEDLQHVRRLLSSQQPGCCHGSRQV